jgi:hypothetical protein
MHPHTPAIMLSVNTPSCSYSNGFCPSGSMGLRVLLFLTVDNL